MCDTIVVMPSLTKNGKMIFAKNSDRSPNEPHIIERIPATDHDLNKEPFFQATYIKVKQVEHTFAVTLFKPSWIWGAEMGFNEHGVNIGNEAVFTKEKRGSDALIGMDLLRIALERSKTAYEAMICITKTLEEYGQGGNCGYQKQFYYDNSYLIADGKEAIVLETAGKYWAAIKVKDLYSISNGLTIESDFDYAHPDILSEKATNPKFSFKKRFTEPIFTHFSQSKKRRDKALQTLNKNIGIITVETILEILRSHNHKYKQNSASVGSICMHAGGLIGDHTTGSYIVEYHDEYNLYYATGASLPCLSVFKPLLQEKIEGEPTNKGIKYWLDRERLTRYFLAGNVDKTGFIEDRDNLENEMFSLISQSRNIEDIMNLIPLINTREQELIDKYLNPIKNISHKFILGKGYYRKYWTKKTNNLKKDLYNYM